MVPDLTAKRLHNPAQGRAAYPGDTPPPAFTAKRLHNPAQGRGAHPGDLLPSSLAASQIMFTSCAGNRRVFRLPTSFAILKRESSKWIKDQRHDLEQFYWQGGYGAFSVSPAHVESLKSYIANQEERHRKVTFQDEFRRLCKKYGAEIDERYAWD
jgi:hypothetical protein